jgi:hypothetical protein
MAGITENIEGTTTFITNIIVWITDKLSNLLTSIGFGEIFFALLIGFGIWFWINQHNVEPIRVRRF